MCLKKCLTVLQAQMCHKYPPQEPIIPTFKKTLFKQVISWPLNVGERISGLSIKILGNKNIKIIFFQHVSLVTGINALFGQTKHAYDEKI